MQRITAAVGDDCPMVAWRSAGREPSVVCIHGAGISSREFQRFIEVLGRTHDAWTVDLPGFDEIPMMRGLLPTLRCSKRCPTWLWRCRTPRRT